MHLQNDSKVIISLYDIYNNLNSRETYMFNNPYEAPQGLATGGHVTKELNSVTVHFDDIH